MLNLTLLTHERLPRKYFGYLLEDEYGKYAYTAVILFIVFKI